LTTHKSAQRHVRIVPNLVLKKPRGGLVPDFEIRYFHADGTPGIVRITTHNSLARAQEHAREHQGSYVRFEVLEIRGEARGGERSAPV
jgi:hypothetical protein